MPNSEENIKDKAVQETEETQKDAQAASEAEKTAAEVKSGTENEEALIEEEPAEEDKETVEASGTDDGKKEEPETKAGEAKEEKKERKFFKKKEKKDKKDEKIEELTDKLTRQMAEFDNYRKRTEKEKAANYIVGARDVIEKLLPVVDNFERGLAGADTTDPFADGMNKIYKQLTTLLSDLGVTPIEAVGKEFDPNYHNAVMHVDDDELGENIIAEEFQKGYMYKDQVVRHSMVKVAN